jgi:hypothetical protein
MIWLVNYLRRAFCKHEFTFSELWCQESYGRTGTKINMLCKKCGYTRNKWKFW